MKVIIYESEYTKLCAQNKNFTPPPPTNSNKFTVDKFSINKSQLHWYNAAHMYQAGNVSQQFAGISPNFIYWYIYLRTTLITILLTHAKRIVYPTLALHIHISLIKAFMHSFSQNPSKLTVRLLASFSVKIKVLRQPWPSILFGCESQ